MGPVRTLLEAKLRLAEEVVSTRELGAGDKRSAIDVADEMKLIMDGVEMVEIQPPVSDADPLEDLVNDPRLLTKYVEASLQKEIPEDADKNFGIGVIIVKCPTLREKAAELAARGPPTSKELHQQMKKAKAAMLENQRNGNQKQAITDYYRMQDLEKQRDATYIKEKEDAVRKVEEEKEAKKLQIQREKEEAAEKARAEQEAILAEKRARTGFDVDG